jgi:Uma2 family endonuclease
MEVIAEHTVTAGAMPSQTKRRWTYSELQALSDQRRVELYDGELVELTAPKLRHQEILRRLLFVMEGFVQEHNAGKIYIAPHDVYISETKFFEPDLSFVRKERFASERIEREDGACLIAPPDLIVEIISESTGRNDRVKKFNAYATFGVRHYWIIDPDEQTWHAYTLENGRYAAEAALTAQSVTDEQTGHTDPADEAFMPSLFPGLRIPLARIFGG